MVTSRKPAAPPATPFRAPTDPDPLHTQGKWIWAPLRSDWSINTPEESVRQAYIYRLHERYGYSLAQMAQERRTQSGRKSPKADIVVCRNAAALQANRDYVIVVECKSDNVSIDPDDYDQGESYARAVGCEFLVTHNTKETRYFRLRPGAPGRRIDIENIPAAADLDDLSKLAQIRRATKAFTRDEFRAVLHDCHSILRDNHKLEPGRAFDEISKILFIKMWVERTGDQEKFTRSWLDQYAHFRGRRAEVAMQDLFEDTVSYYSADGLFDADERLEISYDTFLRLVDKLERFNLSATADDVKGIAFERFLGQTFRGELGQFFTPRPVVDFMVAILDPRESETICDPASGTGGFLIRCFEHVRSLIEADIHGQKAATREALDEELTAGTISEAEHTQRISDEFHRLNQALDVSDSSSRLYAVAHYQIFGVDAESRAARTSKMNMIMHGDGHGGIHHFDGLLDVNGIFSGRFDVVLTNPPFGSTVRDDLRVGATKETTPETAPERVAAYERRFGDPYRASRERLKRAASSREPILSLFDIGRSPVDGGPSAKLQRTRATEMLFVERCLKLLKPGGRLGIVLPEGLLNNPSAQWLRDYCQDRAQLLAVVSLPQEVFASAKATVKTSLVFLRRLSEREEAAALAARQEARQGVADEIDELEDSFVTEYQERIETGDDPDAGERLAEVRRLEAAEPPVPKEQLMEASRKFRAALPDNLREVRKRLRAELRGKLRELTKTRADEERRRVRDALSYPVFMVEIEHAGITATGVTGPDVPNDLPAVVEAFRAFQSNPASLELPTPPKLA